ncbi:MAG: anti-sigma factor family protein [Candidatus Aminicenantales bacterium]
MGRCRLEELIDGYLLNRLDGEEAERFEEHYFNCPRCFAQLQARDELIRAVKEQGPGLVQDLHPARPKVLSWASDVWMTIVNHPWTLAPAVAALFLAAILIFSPFSKEKAPSFILNGDSVIRGQAINLISPIIDVSSPPLFFEWKKQGENLEYKIAVFNSGLLWTATTRETRIQVPEEVRQKMIPGEKYSWQVKAFSATGALLAVSSRVQFMIKPQQ